MKFILGNDFHFKKNRPITVRYQFEKRNDVTGKSIKKKNFNNLFVYFYIQVYVKIVYNFMYYFIFPFSSLVNKFFVNIIFFLRKMGVLKFFFLVFFNFYKIFIKIFMNRIININALRFLFYVLMIHIRFRNPGSMLKDFVAKKLKLSANNDQAFFDYLFGVVTNSYLNFNTTDIKFDYWTIKKKKIISFFVLYEEKEDFIMSNKDFLEKTFELLIVFQKNDVDKIEAYKNYCWKNFLFFVSFFLQRPSIKNLFFFMLGLLLKILKILFLLLIIPSISYLFQFFLLPLLKSFIFFINLVKIFIKELFFSFFFTLFFLFEIFIILFSLAKTLFSIFSKKLYSYQKTVVFFCRVNLSEEKRTIKIIKIILLPFVKIYKCIPSKERLKKFFIEDVIERGIEPTILNNNDGFLFFHKQKSYFNNKTRRFFDNQLLDYIVMRDEHRYWEYEAEDTLDEETDVYVQSYLSLNFAYPQILEQDETDDEEDEDEDIDFWLMYNNYFEYDVITDTGAFLNWVFFLLVKTPFSIIIFWISFFFKFFTYLNQKFCLFFYWADDHLFDNATIDFYLLNLRHKMLNVWIWGIFFPAIYCVTSFGHDNWSIYKLTSFKTEYVTIWGYASPTKPFTVFIYLWFIWIFYYLNEHFPNEENDTLYEDREDTAVFNDDFDDQVEDFALVTWAFAMIDFFSANSGTLITRSHRYIEDLGLYKNMNQIDLALKLESALKQYISILGAYLDSLLSFFL